MAQQLAFCTVMRCVQCDELAVRPIVTVLEHEDGTRTEVAFCAQHGPPGYLHLPYEVRKQSCAMLLEEKFGPAPHHRDKQLWRTYPLPPKRLPRWIEQAMVFCCLPFALCVGMLLAALTMPFIEWRQRKGRR